MLKKDIPLTISLPELLDGDRDDSFREMVSVLGAVANQAITIRANQSATLRRVHAIDLTPAEVSFLWAVVKTAADDSTTIRRIARYQRISQAAVSATLNSLTKKGFVEKRADAIDSRRHILSLTDEGREAIRVSATEQRKVNDVQFSGITKTDVLELTRILSSILERGNLVLEKQERD